MLERGNGTGFSTDWGDSLVLQNHLLRKIGFQAIMRICGAVVL